MREAARRDQIDEMLPVAWKNPTRLDEALRDESFVNEHPGEEQANNNNLAFLGDAVLALAVRHHLLRESPKDPNGDLTKKASALVSDENLANRARALQLGPCISLGNRRREENNTKTLARCFEAILGAVFLDQGFERAATLAIQLVGDESESKPTRPGKAV